MFTCVLYIVYFYVVLILLINLSVWHSKYLPIATSMSVCLWRLGRKLINYFSTLYRFNGSIHVCTTLATKSQTFIGPLFALTKEWILLVIHVYLVYRTNCLQNSYQRCRLFICIEIRVFINYNVFILIYLHCIEDNYFHQWCVYFGLPL